MCVCVCTMFSYWYKRCQGGLTGLFCSPIKAIKMREKGLKRGAPTGRSPKSFSSLLFNLFFIRLHPFRSPSSQQKLSSSFLPAISSDCAPFRPISPDRPCWPFILFLRRPSLCVYALLHCPHFVQPQVHCVAAVWYLGTMESWQL